MRFNVSVRGLIGFAVVMAGTLFLLYGVGWAESLALAFFRH